MRVGCTPARSTRHGTSTHRSSGRFVISPVLRTLPYTTDGSPVTIELMMSAAYSWDRSKGASAAPCRSVSAVSSNLTRFRSDRRTYSSTGMRKRSTRSGRSRNQGTYSAECSDDSVGK
jgi:hypothetical protein